MAQERSYSHIAVTSDEEDDVVIQAGAVPGRANSRESFAPAGEGTPDASKLEERAGAGEEVPRAEAERAYMQLAEQMGLQLSSADIDALGQAADDEARKEYLVHLGRRQRRIQREGMATTEVDLRAKMPFAKMQLAIVTVLLLLLVAALVYWFVLR